MWRKGIFALLALVFWCSDASAWLINQPFNATQNKNLCSWMGRTDKYRAYFKDVWRSGDYSQPNMYPGSYCPLEGGRSTNLITGERLCWVDKRVGRFNIPLDFGQLKGNAKNKITDISFSSDVCYNYYTTAGFSTSNHTKMCADKDADAVKYYMFYYPPTPEQADVIDCGNAYGPGYSWSDSQGNLWVIIQDNQSQFLTGYVNTDAGYNPVGRCGWWNLTGTLLSDGTFNITVVNPGGSRHTTTATQVIYKDTCLGRGTVGGGRLLMWESSDLRWTNELGFSGSFRMTRNTVPAWWDNLTPLPHYQTGVEPTMYGYVPGVGTVPQTLTSWY